MKTQKILQWFILFFLVMSLTDCAQSTESSRSASPIAPASAASAPETIQPTLALIATNTSEPSSMPTDVSTLPVKDARRELLDLLANNGGCQLPCLWGIMPGKSTNREAYSILAPLIGISSIFAIEPSFKPQGGGVLPGFSEDKNDLVFNTKVSYLADNQIVGRITFRVQEEKMVTDSYGNLYGEPIFDFPSFAKRIEYYSLSHVLSEQGMPNSVLIEGAGLSPLVPTVPARLHVALLYPNLGIWVDYALAVDYVGNVIRGCPINAHIQMELYPPGNSDSFFTLLDQTNWGTTKSGYLPLEKATSMSVDEFYQIFRASTDNCIETPVNLWPTPESGGG